MNTFRALAGVALVFGPAVAFAAPAFDISGLHIELPFNAAVAQAEKLGGVCQLSTSRREDAVYAKCENFYCEEASATVCDKQDLKSSGPAIAEQPVIRVGLEAPTDTSPLTRIVIVFEGSSDVVEAHLSNEHGPPHRDGSVVSENSWTHARRLLWRQGKNNLGLWLTNNAIILTADSENPSANVP